VNSNFQIGLIRAFGLPKPEAEYKFHPTRKWRFDLAWPEQKVALEIEGGLYGVGKPCPLCKRRSVGAHTSIQRLKGDMKKYNAACSLGWRVLRVQPEDMTKISTVTLIKKTLGYGK